MPVMTPYKLQIPVSEAMRKALKSAAHRHETTMTDLVVTWLEERLAHDTRLPAPARPVAPEEVVRG